MKTGLTVASERAAIEKLAINTIRTLCMDAVQAANSGHPGSPMGMAPTAYVLWQRFLRFDPDQTIWGNRDRFVLSAGHRSTLLYALLHLTGVKAVNPAYRESVLPSAVTARVSVESASTFGWERYVGMTGQALGMKTFGASAPLKELQKKFGFTPEHVVAAAREQLKQVRR